MSLAPASPRSALRGSPQRHSNFKEQLQDGYLHAVAAAAGCVMYSSKIDEGVDWTLTHKAPSHSKQSDGKSRLELQLKATTAPARGGAIAVSIPTEQYDYFRVDDPSVPKIFVIMAVPPQPAHWVFARPKGLMVHRCAYWVNLEGLPAVQTRTVTVKAPLSQVFNDLSLCDIMERIGQGVRP